MINFIKWGLDHDSFPVVVLFTSTVALASVAWFFIILGAVLYGHWGVVSVLISPVPYAFFVQFRAYKSEQGDSE